MILIYKLDYGGPKELLIPIFADDDIYQKAVSGIEVDEIISKVEDGLKFVDSIFNGNQNWQLATFPVANDENREKYRLAFPNAFYDPDLYTRLGTSPIQVQWNEYTIPEYNINGGSASRQYRVCAAVDGSNHGTYNSYYPFSFPHFGISESFNALGQTVSSDISFSFGLLPESCVSENGIDLSQVADSMLLTFEVWFGQDKNTGNFELHCVPFKGIYKVDNENIEFWLDKSPEFFEDDPYNPGGDSGTGGGGGNFDNTSTPIEIPSLPSISAASTGFISLYNPTLAELNDLASYLWSDLFSIETLKKLFADPMDVILGLSILPVTVPSGGLKEVKVGNIATGISLTVAASQFVEVDCGTINVNEYWGAYLDYEPYTQAQIFLPYIGTRPISVDEIMGKTVRVVYHVDILTGACCCFVKCGDSVLYTYNGQCSIPIPVTGANYTSVVNGILSIAGSAAALVATGGQAAPLIAAGAAAGAKKTAVAKGAAAKAQLTNAQIETGSNVASNVANQMKPQIAKSGSISGGAGLLNMQTPYLILIRPRQALPSKQNEFIGYPSLITVQLTELSGYTEVQSIHLENIPATSQELDEIEGLLKGGVIF